jgi:hypothetical protein
MERQQMQSRFFFQDQVSVKLAENSPAIPGKVVGISFTESKVFYDVETEYELLIRMDSSFVNEMKIAETENPVSAL